MDKAKIINVMKNAYKNMRIAKIKPTGILATRLLIGVLFLVIVEMVAAYTYAFVHGYVSDDVSRFIDVGIKIVIAIFTVPVLTSIMGFLALWIDKDHNGIPDKLEDDKK